MAKKTACIMHHTAGSQKDTVASVRKFHVEQRKYKDIGYHYLFEIRGNHAYLKHGRDPAMQGCHGVNYWNSVALGICVAGNYSKYAPSETIYQDILSGVCHVLQKHSIKPDRLFGHRDVKATECPGKLFPLARLKADVKRKL
ncbi:MAG: peptidoglycan recognition family protein, partial [bacterium]|nr:peptidoglycan recognition family protein [bacterium]